MIVVIDASVALKWFFSAREDEAHVDNALEILRGIDDGKAQMVQPPHFLAEVAAVLAAQEAQLAVLPPGPEVTIRFIDLGERSDLGHVMSPLPQ